METKNLIEQLQQLEQQLWQTREDMESCFGKKSMGYQRALAKWAVIYELMNDNKIENQRYARI